MQAMMERVARPLLKSNVHFTMLEDTIYFREA